ncbi:hypothetical protein LAZ40_06945 [Cereibacter sphaeroides]|uniref:hypothetical protein n=1 Tax=Cereibacter sphaeroides TaxID=1063 RepID=UPI001F36A19C|nr:hypothetical protein [Cereibacter sphaeroides]MCE6958784.1 hypothetical protein [Cereibacter sphaeroides]MCE6973342.1 hypothetical protein [Cereibacter sphaeroides]
MTQNALAPASKEDTAASHALPTTFSNRFHMTAGPEVVRIAFGEQVLPDDQVKFHMATMMPRAEAVAFLQSLGALLAATGPTQN